MNISTSNNQKKIKNGVILLLSTVSSIATLCYLDKTESIFAFVIGVAFFYIWRFFPQTETKDFYILNGAFSFLFTFSTVIGKKLDFNLSISGWGTYVWVTIGLFCTFFPVVSIISKKLANFKAAGNNNKRFRQGCWNNMFHQRF